MRIRFAGVEGEWDTGMRRARMAAGPLAGTWATRAELRAAHGASWDAARVLAVRAPGSLHAWLRVPFFGGLVTVLTRPGGCPFVPDGSLTPAAPELSPFVHALACRSAASGRKW